MASFTGCKIYLIGGIVRDMLLNIPSHDIDITVIGNCYELGKALEQKFGAKILSIHKEFGGIKISLDNENIDFTSTRSEKYPQKGHLPVTKLGCSLKEDVIRRDFTVNSLAFSLNKDNFGELIDFVNGFEDLKKKELKILHKNSFIDDPTRIIRGLKYSVRLGFELNNETKKLQDKYMENINYDMGYNRIKNEIKLTFEQNSSEALSRFINQKIYKLISQEIPPKITFNIEEVINKYKPENIWIIYFGLFIINKTEEFLTKFELTKYEKNIIINAKKIISSKIKNDNFEIYKALCKSSVEALILASNFSNKEQITKFLDELKDIKISITGKDLINLGYKPSKSFKSALDHVLRHKLNNSTLTRAEEIILINQYFSAEL